MHRRWHEGGIAVLGLWAIASPWVFTAAMHQKAFGGAEAVTQNFWTVGLLVAAMAWTATSTLSAWLETGLGLAGAWLVVSPWVVGYRGSTPLTWNAVSTGVAISILAMLGLVKVLREVDVVGMSDR
jgi:hypothetical protein